MKIERQVRAWVLLTGIALVTLEILAVRFLSDARSAAKTAPLVGSLHFEVALLQKTHCEIATMAGAIAANPDRESL